jgi:hypothetical protein
MSPEQLAGEATDARSDQFSFCVTLAEALSGARPFVASSREQLQAAMKRSPTLAGVPRGLRPVLQRGLSVDRERRFPSMEALFTALRSAQRRPRIAVAIALTVGALAAGLFAQRALTPEQTAVLVATVDIEEGTVVTAAVFAPREMPAQYVTSSVVKSGAASFILGKRVLVPIQAGDMLQWSQFESSSVGAAQSP